MATRNRSLKRFHHLLGLEVLQSLLRRGESHAEKRELNRYREKLLGKSLTSIKVCLEVYVVNQHLSRLVEVLGYVEIVRRVT